LDHYKINFKQATSFFLFHFSTFTKSSASLFLTPIKPSLMKSILCFALCISMMSCSGQLDKNEYVKWVQSYENGLHVRKEWSQFVFDLQYQPSDFLALTNSERTRETSSSSKSSPLQYYLLTISCKDPQYDILTYDVANITEKQQRVYYYSYLFQQDIFLEEAGSRFPCVLFHFEQAGMNSGRKFLLGFDAPVEEEGESTLVVQSSQFGSLPIKITVTKQNIPKVKI
jgi:hypothetical protein